MLRGARKLFPALDNPQALYYTLTKLVLGEENRTEMMSNQMLILVVIPELLILSKEP